MDADASTMSVSGEYGECSNKLSVTFREIDAAQPLILPLVLGTAALGQTQSFR
jgi:hypothetical protein